MDEALHCALAYTMQHSVYVSLNLISLSIENFSDLKHWKHSLSLR